MKDERLEKLADVLVNYSTKVKKGDRVAISAEDAALPFIKAVARAAVKAGALVEYYIDVPDVDAELLKNGTEEQYARENIRFGACAKSDVWISAWGSENTKTMQSIEAERLKQKRLANKDNRKIYSERMGTGELRWCGTQFPTNGDAQNAGMSLEEYEDFVYTAGYLYEEDPVAKWQEMAAWQEKWASYLDGKKELHILSKDTDIFVNVAGRKWINCCGDANFPDGEIFTSPVEDEEMLDTLLSYVDTDAGSRYFGEVAIGTNYGIQRHTKNILFDEKIGGSMHMAIGEAFREAGGKNESAIHWDMINDMTREGKIYADGELFYENGKFKEEILKKS